MGSGNRRIRIVTRERASSQDIVRLQSFLARDSHEAFRGGWSRSIRGDWYNFPGLEQSFQALPGASDRQVPHDCISGLMVRPDNATGLLVDPGVAGFFVPSFPNSNADDSDYIVVQSDGVAVLATLPFSVNAGPGVRWDIVECQPTEATLESASVQVFNTSTQEFDTQSEAKVLAGALTFRIRSGTQGGGIPNPDREWLPLAAVHVRADATGFTNCDVYDIRPLVSERCAWSPENPLVPPASATNNVGYRLHLAEAEYGVVEAGSVNGMVALGYFRGHFGGFYSGGAIRCNQPSPSTATFGNTTVTGASYEFFNPEAAINQSADYVQTASKWFTIGAFFPRGYPRWVRYSQAAIVAGTGNHLRASGRLPQGPRGILQVVFEGGASNGIILPKALPTHFGETEDAWGHAVNEGYTDSANECYPAEGGAQDRSFHFVTGVSTPGSGATPASYSGNNAGQLLIPGVDISTAGVTTVEFYLDRVYPTPPYAKAILVQFTVVMAFAAPGTVNLERIVQRAGQVISAGPAHLIECPGTQNPTNPDTSDSYTWQGALWVPLYPSSESFDNPAVPPAGYTALHFSHTGTGAPSGAVSGLARLLGYRL